MSTTETITHDLREVCGEAGGVDSPTPSASITLPLPVSANRIWRKAKGRIYKNPEYVNWQRTAGQLIAIERKLAGMASISGAYDIAITLPEKTRCDPDNYLKGLNDTLQKHGVIENDRLCRKTQITRGDVPRGHCHVVVSAI